MKNKIKEVRKMRGITQKELAEKLDVTPQAVSQFEKSDGNRFTMATLQNIAIALDCEVDDLITTDNGFSLGYELQAEKRSEGRGVVTTLAVDLSELNRMGQDALEDYLSLLLQTEKYTVHDIEYLTEVWGKATVERFYPEADNSSEDGSK